MNTNHSKPSAIQPIRVMVVDDSPMFLASLCEFLGRHNALAVVGGAGDGRMAIDQLIVLHPDLVIMDVSMPIMSGPDAAMEMRRLLPDVRIIMVSIHQDTEAESLGHGVDRFVPKIGIHRQLLPEIESLFPHLKSGNPWLILLRDSG